MISRLENLTAPSGTPAVPSPMGGGAATSADRVDAFFGVLVSLLRLPEPKALAIREELESHVRERIRDLEVSGLDEPQAVDRALAELGEAAALADRFRKVHANPRRRLLMNLAVVAVAASALAVSIGTLVRQDAQPSQASPWIRASKDGLPAILLQVQPSVLDAHGQPVEFVPTSNELPLAVFTPQFGHDTQPGAKPAVEIQESPLADVFNLIARAGGHTEQIAWARLEEQGTPRDTLVTIKVDDTDPRVLFRLLNDQLGLRGPAEIDFRVEGNRMEVNTAREFDLRERETVCYRLGEILEGRFEPGEVRELITGMVEPDNWRDSGGELAELHAINDVLFIKAPPRMHTQIRWILDELMGRGQDGEHAGLDPRRVDVVRPMLLDLAFRTAEHPLVGTQGAPMSAWWLRTARATLLDDQAVIAQPITRSLALSHTDTGVAADALRGVLGALGVDDTITVQADPRANAIILSGPEARVLACEQLVWKLDALAGVVATPDSAPVTDPNPIDPTSSAAATRSFTFSCLDAKEVRDLLSLVFNVAPALRQCDVERILEIPSGANALNLTATSDQIDAVARLLELIDRPAPDRLPPGHEATRVFRLAHATPSGARKALELIFDVSPALKQCAVGRSIACDDRSRRLTLTATADQIDVVARLLALIDAGSTDDPARGWGR